MKRTAFVLAFAAAAGVAFGVLKLRGVPGVPDVFRIVSLGLGLFVAGDALADILPADRPRFAPLFRLAIGTLVTVFRLVELRGGSL